MMIYNLNESDFLNSENNFILIPTFPMNESQLPRLNALKQNIEIYKKCLDNCIFILFFELKSLKQIYRKPISFLETYKKRLFSEMEINIHFVMYEDHNLIQQEVKMHVGIARMAMASFICNNFGNKRKRASNGLHQYKQSDIPQSNRQQSIEQIQNKQFVIMTDDRRFLIPNGKKFKGKNKETAEIVYIKQQLENIRKKALEIECIIITIT